MYVRAKVFVSQKEQLSVLMTFRHWS